MIQLTTQSLPGLTPAPRAAGFPLGTTSDFALALAELAGAPAGVVAAPGAPVALPTLTTATMPKRQMPAAGGTMLPVAVDTTVLDCLATDVPAPVPVEGIFLAAPLTPPVVGQPVVTAPSVDDPVVVSEDEEGEDPTSIVAPPPGAREQTTVVAAPVIPNVRAEDKSTRDDTDSVVASAPAKRGRTSVIAEAIIPDMRAVAVTPLPVSPVADAPRAAVAPSVTVTAPPPVTPSLDRVAAPIRSIGTDTTAVPNRKQPSAAATSAEAGPLDTPVRAPIAPAVATSPATASPTLTVSDTVPEPETTKQSAAAPNVAAATPEVAVNPAPTPMATRREVPAAGPAPIAVPTGTPETIPVTVATTAAVPADTPIVARPSVPTARSPNLATLAIPQPDAPPAPVSATVTEPSPAVTRRLDQAFAPIVRTVAPSRATSIPVTPARAELPTMPAVPQPTLVVGGIVPAPLPAPTPQIAEAVVVPFERVAPPPAILASAPAAPTQPVALQPVEQVPVTVTIVPLAVTPPPVPQLQPAAQAFAAAMFAASAPIDRREDASDDDLLPLTLTTAAPAAAQSPTIAVAASTQGQAPALDMAKDDWMATMIDRIETLRDDSGGVRETRMKLLPEALGSVEVSVWRDETGAIQVRIAADTAQARAMLTEAAPKLAEMAEARGVKLGGSSVDAGAGDARRDTPAQAPAPVARRPASVRSDTTDTASDTRLA